MTQQEFIEFKTQFPGFIENLKLDDYFTFVEFLLTDPETQRKFIEDFHYHTIYRRLLDLLRLSAKTKIPTDHADKIIVQLKYTYPHLRHWKASSTIDIPRKPKWSLEDSQKQQILRKIRNKIPLEELYELERKYS